MNNALAAPLIPRPALWLGAAGAIPFLGCAMTALVAPLTWASWAVDALAIYAAIILSFLGGVQWGLSINQSGTDATYEGLTKRLFFSVLPALVGWVALLLPKEFGLPLMLPAFAMVFAVDVIDALRGLTPTWYPKLRMPLTLAVLMCLTAGIFA